MPTPPRQRHSALAWVVAALVLFQSLASSVFLTWGPAHSHSPPPMTDAFTDGTFNLWAPVAAKTTAPPPHAHAAFGHFHTSADGDRHHHARGDASVTYQNPADLGGSGGGDQQGQAPSLSAGMVSAAMSWCVPDLRTQPPRHAAWPCTSADVRRIERPPLRVAAL